MKKILVILFVFASMLSFGQHINVGSGFNVQSYELLDAKAKITYLADTSSILADSGQVTYAIDSAKYYSFDGTYWNEMQAGVDTSLLITNYDLDTTLANSLDIEVDSFNVSGKWINSDIVEYDRSNVFTNDLQIPSLGAIKDVIHDSTKWVYGTIGIYYNDRIGIGTATPTEMLDVHGNMWITGNIDGPYIQHPATDNIFFGESFEVADSVYTQIERVAGESLTSNTICYTYSDGRLYKCLSNVDSKVYSQYFALETKSAGQPIYVATPNSFIMNGTWSWTIGSPIYISKTGALTESVTTISGEWICKIGYAVSETSIYFKPEKPIKIL